MAVWGGIWVDSSKLQRSAVGHAAGWPDSVQPALAGLKVKGGAAAAVGCAGRGRLAHELAGSVGKLRDPTQAHGPRNKSASQLASSCVCQPALWRAHQLNPRSSPHCCLCCVCAVPLEHRWQRNSSTARHQCTEPSILRHRGATEQGTRTEPRGTRGRHRAQHRHRGACGWASAAGRCSD